MISRKPHLVLLLILKDETLVVVAFDQHILLAPVGLSTGLTWFCLWHGQLPCKYSKKQNLPVRVSSNNSFQISSSILRTPSFEGVRCVALNILTVYGKCSCFLQLYKSTVKLRACHISSSLEEHTYLSGFFPNLLSHLKKKRTARQVVLWGTKWHFCLMLPLDAKSWNQHYWL